MSSIVSVVEMKLQVAEFTQYVRLCLNVCPSVDTFGLGNLLLRNVWCVVLSGKGLRKGLCFLKYCGSPVYMICRWWSRVFFKQICGSFNDFRRFLTTGDCSSVARATPALLSERLDRV